MLLHILLIAHSNLSSNLITRYNIYNNQDITLPKNLVITVLLCGIQYCFIHAVNYSTTMKSLKRFGGWGWTRVLLLKLPTGLLGTSSWKDEAVQDGPMTGGLLLQNLFTSSVHDVFNQDMFVVYEV